VANDQTSVHYVSWDVFYNTGAPLTGASRSGAIGDCPGRGGAVGRIRLGEESDGLGAGAGEKEKEFLSGRDPIAQRTQVLDCAVCVPWC
jgi:hypothetical protein